jgi:TonB family protein
LLSLDEANIAMVLRHEREHRAAGDQRLLIASTVLTALVPWNLGLWWQMRRLRLAVEMDCDARVLRADPRVDRYGSLLLAIAQHPRAALHGAATLTESTSDLERRIDAMTMKRPTAPRLVAAAFAVAALALAFVACELPSPEVPMDPATAAKAPANDYFEFQLDSPAKLEASSSTPTYPAQLRAANIGGTVMAKFVADTDGRVDMTTIEIMKSDHDLFTHSVRQWLTSVRLTPARVGGRRVRQVISMPFVFSLDGTRTDAALIRSADAMVLKSRGKSALGRTNAAAIVSGASPAPPRVRR